MYRRTREVSVTDNTKFSGLDASVLANIQTHKTGHPEADTGGGQQHALPAQIT
jgi:hypothetical protein